MTIFITGASGFIGGHIARSLSGSHALLGLARSERSAASVRATGATPVRGALGAVDPASLSGVEAVVHVAAWVGDWGSREEYFSVNVEGTRQLLSAARQAGVSRFIHVGTEAACFVGEDLIQIDESAPLRPDSPLLYSASKAAAEQLVIAADTAGFCTVSLRPRLVWGPGDTSVLPGVLRILDDGGFWWMDGGAARTSTCHVDNFVAAVRCALTAPAEAIAGQAFFIADDGEVSIREFLTALVGTAGRELPTRSLPGWLPRRASWALAWLWRTTGREGPPPLTPLAATMMSRTITVQTGRARQRLGWEPVISRQDGLAALRSG